MKEQLVREGKYICEIITAIPKEIAITQNLGEDRIEYQFPLKLVEYNDPLLPTYLKEKHAVELHILDLMKTNSNLDSKKIRSQVYRVEYLEYLLALLDVRLPRS